MDSNAERLAENMLIDNAAAMLSGKIQSVLITNASAMLNGNLLSGKIYDSAVRLDGEYAMLACREILSMLSDNARRMGPLRDKLQWVELWLKRRHLSSKLSRRVRAYYTEVWANHKGKTACLLTTTLKSGPTTKVRLLSS